MPLPDSITLLSCVQVLQARQVEFTGLRPTQLDLDHVARLVASDVRTQLLEDRERLLRVIRAGRIGRQDAV